MSDGNKYKYAYIAVVPDPDTTDAGICRHRSFGGFEYLFWFKIGDTARAQPEQRTDDYKINPNYRIVPIRFEDNVDDIKSTCKALMPRPGGQILQPGKVLENLYLSGYECGGLGQAISSEWHAICAVGVEKGRQLKNTLSQLLKDVHRDKPGEILFETVSNQIRDLVTQYPSTGFQLTPVNMSTPLVSMVITPPVDKALIDETEQTVTYYIKFDTWYTQRNANAYQIARNEYMTEMPDFTYTAALLEKDFEEPNKDVETKLELVNNAAIGLFEVLMHLWVRAGKENRSIDSLTLKDLGDAYNHMNTNERVLSNLQDGWKRLEVPIADASHYVEALKKFVEEFKLIAHFYLPAFADKSTM